MYRLFLVFAIVSLCAATVAVAQPMGMGGGANLQPEWGLVWGWGKVAPAQSRWPVRMTWQKPVLDSWVCPACSD